MFEGTTGQIIGMGESLSYCLLLPFVNEWVQQVLMESPRRTPMFGGLYSTNVVMVILWFSCFPFFHTSCWCTITFSVVYCRRTNSTHLSGAKFNGMKSACVQKSLLRIPLCVQFYRWFTITTSFTENLYRQILGISSCQF
jgi:hypothetical protein